MVNRQRARSCNIKSGGRKPAVRSRRRTCKGTLAFVADSRCANKSGERKPAVRRDQRWQGGFRIYSRTVAGAMADAVASAVSQPRLAHAHRSWIRYSPLATCYSPRRAYARRSWLWDDDGSRMWGESWSPARWITTGLAVPVAGRN